MASITSTTSSPNLQTNIPVDPQQGPAVQSPAAKSIQPKSVESAAVAQAKPVAFERTAGSGAAVTTLGAEVAQAKLSPAEAITLLSSLNLGTRDPHATLAPQFDLSRLQADLGAAASRDMQTMLATANDVLSSLAASGLADVLAPNAGDLHELKNPQDLAEAMQKANHGGLPSRSSQLASIARAYQKLMYNTEVAHAAVAHVPQAIVSAFLQSVPKLAETIKAHGLLRPIAAKAKDAPEVPPAALAEIEAALLPAQASLGSLAGELAALTPEQKQSLKQTLQSGPSEAGAGAHETSASGRSDAVTPALVQKLQRYSGEKGMSLLAEGDIESLVYLVMMDAAKFNADTLRDQMNDMKRMNKERGANRDLQRHLREDGANIKKLISAEFEEKKKAGEIDSSVTLDGYLQARSVLRGPAGVTDDLEVVFSPSKLDPDWEVPVSLQPAPVIKDPEGKPVDTATRPASGPPADLAEVQQAMKQYGLASKQMDALKTLYEYGGYSATMTIDQFLGNVVGLQKAASATPKIAEKNASVAGKWAETFAKTLPEAAKNSPEMQQYEADMKQYDQDLSVWKKSELACIDRQKEQYLHDLGLDLEDMTAPQVLERLKTQWSMLPTAEKNKLLEIIKPLVQAAIDDVSSSSSPLFPGFPLPDPALGSQALAKGDFGAMVDFILSAASEGWKTSAAFGGDLGNVSMDAFNKLVSGIAKYAEDSKSETLPALIGPMLALQDTRSEALAVWFGDNGMFLQRDMANGFGETGFGEVPGKRSGNSVHGEVVSWETWKNKYQTSYSPEQLKGTEPPKKPTPPAGNGVPPAVGQAFSTLHNAAAAWDGIVGDDGKIDLDRVARAGTGGTVDLGIADWLEQYAGVPAAEIAKHHDAINDKGLMQKKYGISDDIANALWANYQSHPSLQKVMGSFDRYLDSMMNATSQPAKPEEIAKNYQGFINFAMKIEKPTSPEEIGIVQAGMYAMCQSMGLNPVQALTLENMCRQMYSGMGGTGAGGPNLSLFKTFVEKNCLLTTTTPPSFDSIKKNSAALLKAAGDWYAQTGTLGLEPKGNQAGWLLALGGYDSILKETTQNKDGSFDFSKVAHGTDKLKDDVKAQLGTWFKAPATTFNGPLMVGLLVTPTITLVPGLLNLAPATPTPPAAQNTPSAPPQLAADEGVAYSKGTYADIGLAEEAVKDKMEGLNELSEMASMRLQNAQAKYTALLTALSNMTKKFSETSSNIIQNMK